METKTAVGIVSLIVVFVGGGYTVLQIAQEDVNQTVENLLELNRTGQIKLKCILEEGQVLIGDPEECNIIGPSALVGGG